MIVYIATPVKQEELYIREWLSHNKSIGVDKIILADNNDSDYHTPLQPIIQDFIDEGFVTLLDYRDQKLIQIPFYNEVYSKYQSQFDWMGFIDADEFIDLPGFNNIHDFLATITHQSVSLRWYNYSDNDRLTYEDKPVRTRFPNLSPKQLVAFQPSKYFMRPGITQPITHPFYPPTLDVCDALNNLDFKAFVRSPRLFYMMSHNPEYLRTAFISHYPTKTVEEYIEYKVKRGTVFTAKQKRYTRDFFFTYNNYSKEKAARLSAPCKF